jgi:hypothetical protein
MSAAASANGTSVSFESLATSFCWVAWQSELADNKRVTKVPYINIGRKARAGAGEWLTRAGAEELQRNLPKPYGVGGIGIEFCPDEELGLSLAGVDFDQCRDPETGAIELWAIDVLALINSYSEISPSGTGVKVFITFTTADLAQLQKAMGTAHGRQFKCGTGEHPPSIEVYLTNRYFTLTGERIEEYPSEIIHVPTETLLKLINEIGPAFAKRFGSNDNTTNESTETTEWKRLLAEIDRKRALNPRLNKRWIGDWSGLNDQSRSGKAFALAGALRRAGFDRDDVFLALANHPDTKAWHDEKGVIDGRRELHRLWTALEKGDDRPGKTDWFHQDEPPVELVVTKFNKIPKEAIPPRPWLYGHFLLSGACSILAAVDGGGKGAQVVVITLSLITGRSLLGEKVWQTGSVAIVTYEDNVLEWHRRFAAACELYNINFDEIIDRVEFLTHPIEKISFGSPNPEGAISSHCDLMIDKLKRANHSVLIVDPFNHAHGFDDGNANAVIARVAGEMTRVATESNAAVLVLHHLRKGSTGSTDDLMGATSLRATFRSARILMGMTAEEAKALGVTDDPWRYSRIASSKQNYAPPPETATWIKLESVELGNVTDMYPDGDNIQVATSWQPDKLMDGINSPELNSIFETIKAGPPNCPDELFSPQRANTGDRWVGHVIGSVTGKAAEHSARIVKQWLKSGLLIEDTFKKDSKDRQGVKLDEHLAAAIIAQGVPIFMNDG